MVMVDYYGRFRLARRYRRSWLSRRSRLAGLGVTVTVGAAVVVAGLAAPSTAAAAATPATATHPSAAARPATTTPSGTDASCPAARSGSGPLSAPTEARAIGGDGSATVTWCPPPTGAGSVVSYTVTSSAGQSVTADVPNDWAIIDGLRNGASYTFTVTATTSSGATSRAATTRPVIPEPVAPPRNVVRGRPRTVGYDQYSLIIGGRRTVITAGEFDPWRTPSPSLWLDDLEKMKAEGYNAVSAYFDWDYNSPAPGAYDFTGVRDYNEFLNMAQRAGLYVLARPGPNINAETDGGGLAAWVLTAQNGFREDSQPYLSAALQWYSEIDPIIAAHQVTRGGDVIAYQIENADLPNEPMATQRAYMASLESKARSDGIDVPFTFNAPEFTSGTGAVNISGQDSYPLFTGDCGNPTRHFGDPPTLTSTPGEPFMAPEEQDGSIENWGAAGFGDCYTLTGPDFENVYYKDNIAQGITIQSDYMGAGGTNWGWLPYPQGYTSYDYGAPISETGELGTPSDPNAVAGSKYGENKLINDFETSVAPLAKTQPATAPQASNPAVTTVERANPDTGTRFIYLRQADAASTATVGTHLDLDLGASGEFPVVPQRGSITLDGRDSKMLLANDDFAGQQLVYSTSELMTQASIGGRATALVYGRRGSDGETVLHYTSRPNVSVVTGSATAAWDPARGDLRLDYVHNGLTQVEVTGGGRPPLLLLIAGTGTAENFWPERTSAGPVLVEGGYLVRTATAKGGVLELTGDTSKEGELRVWAGASIRSVKWNGKPVATVAGPGGALTGTVPGPAPVRLPALANWRFAPEAPEAQPGFDDSGWTLADHPVSTYHPASGAPDPALYAADYGYDHGFTWYRGHFTATGGETGVTLTADGMAPTGAFSVWLNGTFLGSHDAAGPTTATFGFPQGVLRPGRDNVIAVLTENTGNPEGPTAERSGLQTASLDGSGAPVTWRLMGATGGTTLADPVRGPLNATGLYGTNHGWDLPGYPDAGWRHVTLPDDWASRGVPPGIGWYRTAFSLHLPRESYVPVDVRIGGSGTGSGSGSGSGKADYRAYIFVNGWLIGQYLNDVGPQHRFYVPAGILDDHGGNTLAIAVWGLNAAGGRLGRVSLVAAGDQAGGLGVRRVPSPGYRG
ncbi:MAG: beta-galactosidase [Nocardiopsaceae bacterium]|nr:beta-galactosidase [Nocardiopsaceae bacterium]